MTNLWLWNCVGDPWELSRNNGFNSARRFSMFSKVWGIRDNLLLTWDKALHCGKKEKKSALVKKKNTQGKQAERSCGEEKGWWSLETYPWCCQSTRQQLTCHWSQMSGWAYYVLEAQGLAVCKRHSLPISTDFWVLSCFCRSVITILYLLNVGL